MIGALTIRIKKGKDGPHSLVCIRADGSMTRQKQTNSFFPVHDLMHYAVESAFRYRRGFYGLIAEGWNLEDFGSPWPRGPLPPDLDPVELVVGALSREGNTGERLAAESLNAHIAEWYAAHAPGIVPPTVSEEPLAVARAEGVRLQQMWFGLPPGGTIELRFEA
jgi:hypothetical protein